jgi:hypothetical protein
MTKSEELRQFSLALSTHSSQIQMPGSADALLTNRVTADQLDFRKVLESETINIYGMVNLM